MLPFPTPMVRIRKGEPGGEAYFTLLDLDAFLLAHCILTTCAVVGGYLCSSVSDAVTAAHIAAQVAREENVMTRGGHCK